MTPLKLRLILAQLFLAALLAAPTPPRQDLVQCGFCNTWNEPSNTRCIGCGAQL